MKTTHHARPILAAASVIALLAVVLVFWNSSLAQRPTTPRSTAKKGKVDNMIKVKVFNREGELVGPVETEKLVLTPAEWKKRLTPDQFKILRSSGTERPFCGLLLDNKKTGVYACAGCGLPLFTSTRSSIRAPAGRASFSRSRRRTWRSGMIIATAWCGSK